MTKLHFASYCLCSCALHFPPPGFIFQAALPLSFTPRPPGPTHTSLTGPGLLLVFLSLLQPPPPQPARVLTNAASSVCRLKEQDLPLSTRVFGFRTRSPLTTLQRCAAKAETYDCSALPLSETYNQSATPAWPCSDPDVVGPTKWGALCTKDGSHSLSHTTAHAAAISAALL